MQHFAKCIRRPLSTFGIQNRSSLNLTIIIQFLINVNTYSTDIKVKISISFPFPTRRKIVRLIKDPSIEFTLVRVNNPRRQSRRSSGSPSFAAVFLREDFWKAGFFVGLSWISNPRTRSSFHAERALSAPPFSSPPPSFLERAALPRPRWIGNFQTVIAYLKGVDKYFRERNRFLRPGLRGERNTRYYFSLSLSPSRFLVFAHWFNQWYFQ